MNGAVRRENSFPVAVEGSFFEGDHYRVMSKDGHGRNGELSQARISGEGNGRIYQRGRRQVYVIEARTAAKTIVWK
ncbi:MAG: hypothetical protein ACLUAR_04930 [Pilosibacter sp.]